jgi:hypothetical protein
VRAGGEVLAAGGSVFEEVVGVVVVVWVFGEEKRV